MKFGSTSILGLSIGDREITAAQVSGRNAQKLLHFPIPADASLAQPEALGAQLREALRQHNVSAAKVVVGIPAKWLIAQEKEVPPSDETQAYAMLRLQAERLSVGDAAGMVFDAAGRPDEAKPTRLLIVGALQQQIDRLRRVCEAAGLHVVAMTSTALVLSQQLSVESDRALVVLSRQGAELVWQGEGSPRLLRHLGGAETGTGAVAVAALSTELRRALAVAKMSGGSRELLLWQDRELSPEQVQDLATRIGLSVRSDSTVQSLSAHVQPGAMNGAAGSTSAESFGPAIALALAGASRKLPLDFLHSRLAPHKVSRFGRRSMAGAAVAVLLIGGLIWFYSDVQSREAAAADLEQRLDALQPDVKTAEARIDRVKYARGYFEARTPALQCMREITLSLRPDDPLWITQLSLTESGRGRVQGRAENLRTIDIFRDRLLANPRFANVQSQESRAGTGSDQRFTFTVSFTFLGDL
jgi:hypothetical protein